MNERLLITPHEQKEKIEYLNELIIREKANSELVKKLKEEQSIAIADRDKEVKKILFLSMHSRWNYKIIPKKSQIRIRSWSQFKIWIIFSY